MATITIDEQQFTSVDIKTLFYNRGPVPAVAPFVNMPLEASASRIYPGNLLENSKPAVAMSRGGYFNTLHGTRAFLSVTGYQWRQWRTLEASGSYTIDPRFDCSSVFVISDAGNGTFSLDLTHASILPGMVFKFARPDSAGNLVVNLSNGNVVNPANGSTGTTLTVTQYGFVTLRVLGNAVPGGPKAFIEGSANCTVS